MKQYLVAILSLLLCFGIFGCGDGRPKRVMVAGKVLIDGQPVTHGHVRLLPEHGRPSSGQINEEGRFTLSTYGSSDGCTLGTHKVTVLSFKELGGGRQRWDVPPKYSAENTSDISTTIEGSTDSLLIELTWGDEKGPIVVNGIGE